MKILALALVAGLCAPAAADPLCVNGHPARRRADVSYGGLPPLPGYQRDHRVSLGLGGTDTPDNVWYQSLYGPWNAHDKDRLEWELERRFCKGTMSLHTAADMLRSDWTRSYVKIFGAPPDDAQIPDRLR